MQATFPSKKMISTLWRGWKWPHPNVSALHNHTNSFAPNSPVPQLKKNPINRHYWVDRQRWCGTAGQLLQCPGIRTGGTDSECTAAFRGDMTQCLSLHSPCVWQSRLPTGELGTGRSGPWDELNTLTLTDAHDFQRLTSLSLLPCWGRTTESTGLLFYMNTAVNSCEGRLPTTLVGSLLTLNLTFRLFTVQPF